MPRRTCRNVKQTMNDALSNELNLPAKMATIDGAIQARSQQVGEGTLTEQRCHEESLDLDDLASKFLDGQHRDIVTFVTIDVAN